ncbi:MAG: hypothetical protein ACOY94_06605 [Bacillota bacterium]
MPRDSLRTYKRIHKFKHAPDVERGKIRREIGTYRAESRASERLVERLLQDPEDEALLEQIGASERRASKEHRNARVHKRRLKALEQQGLE